MSIDHNSKENDEQHPIGTWVLLSLVALGMTMGWLLMYFGVFLPRGTVH